MPVVIKGPLTVSSLNTLVTLFKPPCTQMSRWEGPAGKIRSCAIQQDLQRSIKDFPYRFVRISVNFSTCAFSQRDPSISDLDLILIPFSLSLSPRLYVCLQIDFHLSNLSSNHSSPPGFFAYFPAPPLLFRSSSLSITIITRIQVGARIIQRFPRWEEVVLSPVTKYKLLKIASH